MDIRMSFNAQNGAASIPVVTDYGVDSALAELHSAVHGDSSLFPKVHSESFERQQLRGEKPMTFRALDAFIANLARRRREAARRVINAWIGRFGFYAADLTRASVVIKSPNEELLGVSVSHAHLISTVHGVLPDGVDDSEARQVDRAADDAIRQIEECRAAIRRQAVAR